MTPERRGRRVLAALGSLACLAASPVRAGTVPAGLEERLVAGPGMEDLLSYARAANPGIAAAEAGAGGVAAESRVLTSWSDPSLTATWWPEREGDGLPERWEFMLTQAVPAPGKLGAVKRARAAEEEAARIEAGARAREILVRVRESAEELNYLRRAREIARANSELLARLRAEGEAAYARERAGLYDALRAQSQEAQAAFDAALLADLEATELARLNGLLSRPPGAAIGPLALDPPMPIARDVAAVTALAEAAREEVLAAGAGRRRASAAREVASYEARPELMLGAGLERDSALGEEDAVQRYKFELGFTLPILSGKNAGRRTAAESGQAQAEAAEREALDTVRAEVREAWFRAANAARLIRLYRDSLLPQAVATVQRAEVWLREGQGSFSDVVEAEALWYNFRLALARSEADYGKALARLEALAGQALTAPGEGAGIPPTESERAAQDAEWEAARAALREQRAAWERDDSPVGSLLAPDPERLAALLPAAGDDAAAVAALAGEFALADLELLALLRSPGVRAAALAVRATLEGYDQVGALDEVLRSYSTTAGGLMPLVGAAPMGDAPQMRFPFPGMLALKGEIVAQEARAASEDRALARREALAEARRLYWSLAFNASAARIAAEVGELLGRVEQASRARYESGQGPLGDMARAQIAREKNAVELENLAGERAVYEEAVRALLALPGGAGLGRPRGDERLADPREAGELAALALERRQELRRMRAEAGALERMIAMAEREVVPGFSLDLALFENRPAVQAGSAATEPAFATVRPAAEGAGTPRRPWFGGGAAYVREMRERLAALRERIRAEEQRTVAMVREGWFAVERARREERLYAGRVAELSRLASETLERSYRVGRATLAEVLDAARERLESGLEAARRRADHGAAVAALENVVGAPVGAEVPGAK